MVTVRTTKTKRINVGAKALLLALLGGLLLTRSMMAGEQAAKFPTLLYSAEGAQKIIRYDSEGKVVWEYPAPMARDVWALPNGNVLFCFNREYDGARNDNSSGVTPILRMADTNHLQIRVELNEADVYRIGEGTEGAFTALGTEGPTGMLRVRAVLPSFGPKRLFYPDTAAQVDTRTLQVLCYITEAKRRVYPGQRVTVAFTCPAGP